MRVELAQHALQHIADAGRLDPNLVVPMADIVTGAFNEAVLIATRPNASAQSVKAAREAFRHLVAGLLR
jgi:hypothetical protein